MAPHPLQSLRLSPHTTGHAACRCSAAPLFGKRLPSVVAFPRAGSAYCSAVKKSPTSTTVSEKKDAAGDEKATTTAAAKPAAKPKKAPAKPLPEMMEEDIIPPLKAALEAEDNVSEVKLSFQNNTLEGSFIKEDVPYYFWAFFTTGDLTGPKGFALSSYSNEVSTIEPFLVDEKRVTDKMVVFWVYKRLAGQGILPVWKDGEEEEEAAKE
ncbi:hypothetical protein PR202_ga29236 [Eleusine coracana subsp. coracana]|uniref:Uncharacterized protein n=1 Tax=Eleusine coracana subsp. coracana TaxID=191504 RepID=A0AAV5DKV4_ELECO|nr:hypothetical protein QOZ80_7AG0576520 [Eleusine coracana subsp. coracana]GJN11071.1 hypothetical protein PR202_ga29236 [Eleusine coracana subsp. coracana]